MNTAGNGEIRGCIVVGSGTTGAVIARERSGRAQKMSILERRPSLSETLWAFRPASRKEHEPAIGRGEIQTEARKGDHWMKFEKEIFG